MVGGVPEGRSQRWFEREFQRDTQTYDWWFGPNFKGERAEKKVWQEFTLSNSLFFSTAIQLNNEQLKPAFNWIPRIASPNLLPGRVVASSQTLLARDPDPEEFRREKLQRSAPAIHSRNLSTHRFSNTV
jgi:hypothetical protein